MPLAPGQTVDSVKTAQQIEIEKQREREAWERVREKETLDNAGKVIDVRYAHFLFTLY